ncbi:MAG: hypothetical protein QOJ42_646, partial [Acidobacteriaceae bacterium]|nr:hypothetical protein [Acidobacteriaceae bacterium]
ERSFIAVQLMSQQSLGNPKAAGKNQKGHQSYQGSHGNFPKQ